MPPKNNRVTLKLDKPLWARIEALLKKHPEWGIISVPDFVRRAIDSEIRLREEMLSSRVINACLSPDSEDRRRKGP